MAIALVGTPTSAAGASLTATSVVVTVPTGSVGDLLVFSVSVGGVSATVGAPDITPPVALTELYSRAGSQLNHAVCYRFVQAGDATSYTFTVNVGAPLAGVCARYSGVSSSTFVRFLNVTNGVASVNVNTSVTFAALDNVQDADVTLVAVAMGTDAFNTTQASVLSTPSGWTNVINRLGPTSGVTNSSHTTTALYSELAGTDTPSVTGSAGTWEAVSFAVIDSAAPGTVPSAGGISFVNSATTGQTTAGATIVASVPSGVVDGNLMIAAVGDAASIGGWTAPAGWTPLPLCNAWSNAGTTSQISDIDARLWYRFASSEPANYTFTSTLATNGKAAVIAAYAGVRNPYPIHILNVTKIQGSGSLLSTTSPAPYNLSNMNTVTAGCLVVNVYATGADTTGVETLTPPGATWTTRANVSSTIASDFNAAVAVVDKAGATDLPTATVSRSGGWVVYSLALAGAPVLWKPRLGPNYRR
jgi:hypothetical protein